MEPNSTILHFPAPGCTGLFLPPSSYSPATPHRLSSHLMAQQPSAGVVQSPSSYIDMQLPCSRTHLGCAPILSSRL